MINNTPNQVAARTATSPRHGFTLAEAVIASGFVGIALAGILSLAPALIRGQHEIAERTRAAAAATELLAQFDNYELPDMTPPEDNQTKGLLTATVTGILGVLTPSSDPGDLGTNEPEPITELNTTIRGFEATLHFTTIDPVTLAPDPAAEVAALITMIIRSNGREVYRSHIIRTNAWSQADARRSLNN